jgi:LuxR family transcriptional regulator, maltose regulon positive regulatory protein
VGADQLGLGSHELGRVFAGLALVELHLERNELEAAFELVEQMHVVADATHRVPLQSQVLLHRAKVVRALGDEVAAGALLTQARLLHREPDDAFRTLLDDEAAAQALAFDTATATTLIGGLDGSRVEVGVLRARLALLEGDPAGAAAHLADLPAPTTRRTRVERSLLRALSVVDRDVESATAHLREGLAAGRPERLIRSVVEHGPAVHRLLASYAPDASEEAYLDELMAATRTTVAPGRAEPPTTLVEHLSDREVAVLRYLSSRLTYREIAAALYISVNTLKTHVKSVYRKLEVTSRQEAVDVGRQLRLI